MDVKREKKYALPVLSFQSDEGFQEFDPDTPDSDAENYLTVKLRAVPHSKNTISAYLRTEHESQGYDFVVTDEDHRVCAYKGNDEKLPLGVQYSVYEFGYRIENIESLGTTFRDWLEIQELMTVADSVANEYGDLPVLSNSIDSWTLSLDVIGVALALRFGLDDDEYDRVWESFYENDAQVNEKDGVLGYNVDHLFRHLYQEGYNHNAGRLLGNLADADGEKSIPVYTHLTHHELESESDQYFVDYYTQYGVQRCVFQQTGDSTCVYRGIEIDRGNPHAIKLLESEFGLTVTNTKSVGGHDDLLDKLTAGAGFLKRVREDYMPNVDEGLIVWRNQLAEAIESHINTLTLLVLVTEVGEAEYTQTVESISQKFGSDDPHESLTDDEFDAFCITLFDTLGSDAVERAKQYLNKEPIREELESQR